MIEGTDLFLRLSRSLRNWQLLSFLLVIGNVVVVSGLTQLATSTRYVPYVVELDTSGSATYAGPIEALDMPEERLIVAQLRGFIWNLRMVVDDPIAQQEFVARAYSLADAPVRRQLDRYFAEPENDPRTIAPQASRAAERITILRLPGSETTYQVRWRERYHGRSQLAVTRERSFEGLVTVERVDSLSREALANNPLGLLVTELTWIETTEE